jgi:superfamily II DNA or RNA helicase
MYRPDKPLIDNNQLKLSEELNKIIHEQNNLSIATAYFNIGAFQLLKDSVKKIKQFKLLLGVAPMIENEKTDTFEPETLYKKSLREDLEGDEFHKEEKEAVTALIHFLKGDSVQIRLYEKGFLHGKVYLFDKLAIVGSSNFTYSGLTSNTELNAVLDEPYSRYLQEEWFKKFWDDSRDFKEEFIRLFDESKFGTKEYLPYHIFIKALYELQKDDIEYEHDVPESLPASEVDLANFQEDAVKRIYSRLKSYGGVMIADSVGLGKTWIAKKIIEDFGFYRRQRFLVVCPAGVDETLWRPALKSIGVSENILHMEELGRKDFDFKELERRLGFKLQDTSLIVVDESHNFRNPISNRYEALFTLIEKTSQGSSSKIVLLTATPMNNTHWDLYFQLMLIARGNKRLFLKDGIFDLEREFRKADKGNLVTLGDVLQVISIRRTRQYIKENYKDAKYKDEKGEWTEIRFPKRTLREINYSLDQTYQGLYHDIADKIEKELTLAYYHFDEYRISGKKDPITMGRMKALGAILQVLLLKRLESSVGAFRKSITSQIDFLKLFKEHFLNGKVLRKEFYNKYLAAIEDEDSDSETLVEEMKKSLESVNHEEFDLEKLLLNLDKDIAIFEEILADIKPIDRTKDAKLKEFKQKLLELKSSGKILVFSFYADTVNDIYQALTEDQPFMKAFGKKIARITGSSSNRGGLIQQFLEGDIDLLLSTDILSEGQNLQKAQIIINYDLHWNPVRMIQRAGRIDRIGSPFEEIYIYNFYPEKELETLLDLVRTLEHKIQLINQTVGLDASVLGEVINPKVFGIIRNLKDEAQKEKLLTELEEEQFGGGERFWQPLKNFGLEKLEEFCQTMPHGIQSGLKRGINGVFFYYKYDQDHHLWYLYDLLEEKLLTNKTEILNFIACPPQEPRIIPADVDVFALHAKVREEIQKFFSTGKVLKQVRTMHGRVEKVMVDLRSELLHLQNEYLEENDPATATIQGILEKIRRVALTKKRMQAIRKIWKNYKETHNWQIMLSELDNLLQEKPVLEEGESFTFEEQKLKLICVDFIS